MLKRILALSTVFLSCISLSGCGGGLKIPVGLLPGVYHLKHIEGEFPPGWFFSSSSRFEFKILGEAEDYDKETWLPDGQWKMAYAPALENGAPDHAAFNPNAAMIWSDTPFDEMSCIGYFCYDEEDGNPILGFYYNSESEKAREEWGPFFSWGTPWGMEFMIHLAEKNNYTKRLFTIKVYRHFDSPESRSELALTLTFGT